MRVRVSLVLLVTCVLVASVRADDPELASRERLIKCEPKLPPARDHYPTSWGKRPLPVKVSGYDFVVAFVGTGAKGVLAQKVTRQESLCPCDEEGRSTRRSFASSSATGIWPSSGASSRTGGGTS